MVWDGGVTNRAIPASYYLEAKPAFFGNLPWPITGSDGSGDTLIPAQLRFDKDHDGLPDPWETLYFGGTNVSNGALADDFDQDGFCDQYEFRAGTIPTNAASLLKISGFTLRVPEPEAVIQWQSVSNKTYSILLSTNLLKGFTQTLAAGIPGNPPQNSHTLTVNPANACLYRIVLDE
jgi:hypothetical protein